MNLSAGSNRFWCEVDLESIRGAKLGELFPTLAHLPGPGPSLERIPSIVRLRVKENVELSWEALADLTVGEILAWRATGEGKVRTLLRFLAEEAERRAIERTEVIDSAKTGVVEALVDIAAWGHHNGAGSLLDAIDRVARSAAADAPLEALDVLRRVRASDFGASRLSRYDPEVSFRWLSEQFGEREKIILDERSLAIGSRPTLEELGKRFGVTRERVRQLESKARDRLDELLADNRTSPLRRVAKELASTLRTAAPLTAIGCGDSLDFRSRLLLWIAGPYHLDGDWLVKEPWRTVRALVDHCFASVTDEDTAEFDVVAEALHANGVAVDLVDDLIVAAGGYRRLESKLVRWDRTYAGRAAAVLAVTNRPMSASEILDHLGSGSLRSLRNVLNGDPIFIRLGKDRFGLREWGGDEYHGVVPAMIQRLTERGAMPVEDLAAELANAFGVSPNSISMNATIHPAFVIEDGMVRMRREDEPYEPDRDLRSASECWLVDDAWTLAVDIDEDVLRGSGRSIPEAFAAHLGLRPGETKTLGSEFGDVKFFWGQMPAVGSLRVAAQELGGCLGDRLFVRRPNPFWIDFRISKQHEVEVGPVEYLSFLIGSDPSDEPHVAVYRALGLSEDEVDSEELEELLSRKRADRVLGVIEQHEDDAYRSTMYVRPGGGQLDSGHSHSSTAL